MYNLILSDFLKQRHTFTQKLLFFAPIVPMMLSISLMGGLFFVENSFNWWYTLILPSSIFMIVCFRTASEKRHHRHGLFSVCVDKKKLWLSAVLSNTISLVILNFVFFLLITIATWFFGFAFSISNHFLATCLLSVTFAWQIPLLMLLTEKTGKFIGIFMGLILNMIFGIFFAPTRLWFVPFAIPSRLMCPVIGVMPNGLPVEVGSPLTDTSVIVTGVVMTLALYIITTSLTMLWYHKVEV